MEENTQIYVSTQQLKEIFNRLNGKTSDGENKVIVSYQSFCMNDDQLNENVQTFTTEKAVLEFAYDKHIPGFMTIDFKFKSFEEPELKLFWGRFQKFKNNMSNDPTKEWVFYINILEKSSITLQTETEDSLLIAHVANPLAAFITREQPNNLIIDAPTADNKLIGGNIIRMIVPIEYVQFETTNELDTVNNKSEVLREQEAERYLNLEEEDDSVAW